MNTNNAQPFNIFAYTIKIYIIIITDEAKFSYSSVHSSSALVDARRGGVKIIP